MTTRRAIALTIASMLLSLTAPVGLASAVDSDGDTIDDGVDNCPTIPNVTQENSDTDSFGSVCDNCRSIANSDQYDSNRDGYGNACDADYNNDDIVGGPDYSMLGQAYGSTPTSSNWNPDVDCNHDDVIGSADYDCLVQQFGQNLGQTKPSGLACQGTYPCPCSAELDAFCPCQIPLPICIGAYGQSADCWYVPSSGLALPTWSCVPSTPAPNVLVDVTHRNNYRAVDGGDSDFSYSEGVPGTKLWPFAKLLAADGIVVFEAGAPTEVLNGELTDTLTRINPDILVIVGATEEFSAQEISSIHDWVAAGHGLLAVGETHGSGSIDALWQAFLPTLQIYSGTPGVPVGSVVYPYRWENPPDSGEGVLNGSTGILCPSPAACPLLAHSFGTGKALCPVLDASGGCTDQHATTLFPNVKLDPLLMYPLDSLPYAGYMHSLAFCYGSGARPGRVYISGDARMHTRQLGFAGAYGFQVANPQPPHQGQVNENELYVLNVMRWLSGSGSCPGS